MKKQKQDKDPAKSVQKWTMQTLCLALDVPRSTLALILQKAGLGAEDPVAAGKAVIAHYKAVAESEASDMEKDRARKLKSEANTAEMVELEKAKTLVNVDDMRRRAREFIVMNRETIRRFPGIPHETKVALCEELAKVRFNPQT
jgi:hypothetical protein